MTVEDLPAPQRLSKPDWLRAGVKGIPYIGNSLDELFYGRLEEARWRRLEQTLSELGAIMRAQGVPSTEAIKEEFRGLLEDQAAHIAKATSELKREMLRDLLAQAVKLPSGDVQWESARLAGNIVGGLEVAALEILAALAKLGARTGGPDTDIVVPADGPSLVQRRDDRNQSIELSYSRFVVDQGYKQLTDSKARLVTVGAHGRDRYERVTLTALGEFVTDWCMNEPDVIKRMKSGPAG